MEKPDRPLPFYQKLLIAGSAGAVGGVFGTPGDLINVRMQNDIKLPPEQRRKCVIIINFNINYLNKL